MKGFLTDNSIRLLCLTSLCIPDCDVCNIPVLYLLLFHDQGCITFRKYKVCTLFRRISVCSYCFGVGRGDGVGGSNSYGSSWSGCSRSSDYSCAVLLKLLCKLQRC